MWTKPTRIEAAAAAVADGRPLDWEALAADLPPDQQRLLRQLKSLGVRRRQTATPPGGAKNWPSGSQLMSGFATLLAAVQTVLALAATLAVLAGWDPAVRPSAAYPIVMVGFAVSGAVLVVGGWHDLKARTLGALFVIAASAFSAPITRAWLGPSANSFWATIAWLTELPADAFLPALLLEFVIAFPALAGFVRPQDLARRLLPVAWTSGWTLLVANAIRLAGAQAGLGSLTSALDRSRPLASWYWTVVFVLVLTALVLAVWKARRTLGEEGRRARWLLMAIAAGAAPTVLASLLAASQSPVQSWVFAHRIGVGYVVYGSILSVPATTAWLVLTSRVLEVRLVIRQSLAYLLTRTTLTLLAVVPLLIVIAEIVAGRRETVAQVVTDRMSLSLIVAASAGALMIAARRRVVATLDRWFFNECRDDRVSREAVARIGVAGDVRTIAVALRDEIERAIHPLSIDVLLWDSASAAYRSAQPGSRVALPGAAALAQLAFSAGVVSFDDELTSPVARLLPEEDRRWLIDSGCRFLMALPGRSSDPTGLVALGCKRSGMGYSADDQRFLRSLVMFAAPLIEARRATVRQLALFADGRADEPACECDACGAVVEGGDHCRCGGRFARGHVPTLLAGKFQVERRIGRGGMGVVYRARDIDLDRLVAIKTLPSMSTAAALRLRHEARAMATLSHPNLALIFGLETWRGVPMLVVEYLRAGTLADRLRRGRLAPGDAVALALALAEAVGAMHRVGLLHRDIKPSNVGFQ
ncbi:MAG: protein kinase, partial [Vicinamibacterales bacterium]|nr:protein kinase [Vicinamibacterales bacterium]